MDYFGGGDVPDRDACDSDEDDIARFERQCAERARAEGLVPHDEDAAGSDDEPDAQIRRARILGGAAAGPTHSSSPVNGNEWRQRCQLLQEKLSRREAELSQVRSDLDMIKGEGLGPGDPATEMKQRLVELAKKSRRLQATTESQKSRIKELEAEVKKPRDEARKQAEELAVGALDGMEDWKKKYLAASNELQEVRHKMQELRGQLQRQKKVLLKELGTDDAIEKALAVADDPSAVQWKGRAAQVSQLQRQVRELKEQLQRPGAPVGEEPVDAAVDGEARGGPAACQTPPQRPPPKVAEKERAGLAQAAEKRREEFERLQEEAERLRSEQAEGKKKREALRSRNSTLETHVRDLKASVQDLLRKSDNDDALVAALRRQVARDGAGGTSPSG